MSDSELSELTLQEFVGGTVKVVDLIVQSGGVAVNITGWTFEVTLFAEHVTPFDLITGAGTEITDAAAGKWRFTIPAASTSGLGSVKLSFYVKYTLDGVTYSLGKGEIKVLPAK